jgi:hypothetical protein
MSGGERPAQHLGHSGREPVGQATAKTTWKEFFPTRIEGRKCELVAARTSKSLFRWPFLPPL